MTRPRRSTLDDRAIGSGAEATHRHTAILSRSRETIHGLEEYLRGAGVSTRATSDLARFAEIARDAATWVVFPDDYDGEAVWAALLQLQRGRGELLVLVTASPQRFESMAPRTGALVPLVVPKPAWGWTILDAIRGRGGSSETMP